MASKSTEKQKDHSLPAAADIGKLIFGVILHLLINILSIWDMKNPVLRGGRRRVL